MTRQHVIARVGGRAGRIVLAATVLLVAAGCAAASPPGSGPAAGTPGSAAPASLGAPSSTAAARSASPSVAATPISTSSPVARTDEPPGATLRSFAGAAVPGELGSFSWDGLTSDAPWIVPATGGATPRSGPLEVAFDPAVRPLAWVARWASVPVASADGPVHGTEGSGEIRVRAPAQPGTWALQVEVRLGAGRSATWYWRVEVTR